MIWMCGGELRAEDSLVVRRCQRATGALLLVYMTLQTMLRYRIHGLPVDVAAGIQGAALFGMFALIGTITYRRFRGTATGRLNAQSLLWGAVLTMFAVTVWGFVEAFAPGTVMHVPLLGVPAMVLLLTVLAKVVLMAFPKRMS